MNLPNDFLSAAPSGNLKRRAALLRSLRAFFDDRGFTEVQTPVLSRDTIIDRHLDPIEVRMQLPGGKAETWFLQTSPEQSMKRLLCSEIGSIYQIGPVFRSGELGRLHNPEFTLAEWHDVNAGLEEGLVFLSDLISELLSTPIADRIRFEEAFRLATQLDLFECSVKELAEWSVANGLVERTDWSQDWDDWVNLIFSDRVQGNLGIDRPVQVTYFPASQAALARVSESDTRTAERYEAFYQGVELANGYHELLDAMRSGMPSSCGCALGFDRIVMLACQASSLEQVIAFTAQNA